MRKKGLGIVRYRNHWYGVSISLADKGAVSANVVSGEHLEDLSDWLKGRAGWVAFEDEHGFLFILSFPFSVRKKLDLLIRSELEEWVPFPIDEMAVDATETESGRVLSAALPTSILHEVSASMRKTCGITFQSLASLNALRYFRVIDLQNSVLLCLSGEVATIMLFASGRLLRLRQLFYLGQSTLLAGALKDIGDTEFVPSACILVGDEEKIASARAVAEDALGISVLVPSIRDYVKADGLPDSLWAGLGAALMSLGAKGEINFIKKRNPLAGVPELFLVYATACLAALGLITCAGFYFDSWAKNRALQHLSKEIIQVYKAAFPKSPPVRDVLRAFQDKMAAEEKNGTNTPGADPLSLLDRISASIDPAIDMKLNDFLYDQGEFSFSGTTTSLVSAQKIKAALRDAGGFAGVKLENLELTADKQVKFKAKGKV